MESLLGDEELCLAKPQKWEKKVITFDPTVGSRTNVYIIFHRLFSLV
jgi:hypothetical protein